MDDFLKSMSNENDSVKYVREVISVLISCGFRLNKFISNSTFVLERLSKTEISSKYGIVSSVFDPLGILTPSLIEPKYIIQQLWREKVDWDKPIPTHLNKRRNLWKHETNSILTISVQLPVKWSK